MLNRNKPRKVFVCEECGAQSAKWEGRCSQCGQWNTLTETLLQQTKRASSAADGPSRVEELSSIPFDLEQRLQMSSQEFNRVLGGGLVPGAMVLMSGEPGVGKSTLLLQTSAALAGEGHRVLYVSGEESSNQVRMRAQRLNLPGKGVYFLSETQLEKVILEMNAQKPWLVVVDSIQTMTTGEILSAAGSVAQVRECARLMTQWAKEHAVPVLLAGHVTKDGTVAGPRTLEHMVDVVLNLEGDTMGVYRILRAAKNRFGPTNEIGVFQMGQLGLEEVAEPSLLFLSSRRQDVPGSTVTVTMEGSRPLLVEVQALTNLTVFPQPRRTTSGVDFQRLLLIAAATSKRLGIPFGNQDIIVNIPGGLRVKEPAIDLSVALALISSFRNVPCDPWTVAIGEIGLGGELRGVPHLARRLAEAERLGFRRAIVPWVQSGEAKDGGLELIAAATLGQAVRQMLPKARKDADEMREPDTAKDLVME